METKKTTATEPEEVKAEAQEAAAAAPAVKDEWDEQIEMLIPRKGRGDDQSYYVCVNDRRFYIPADGRMQKLPKPIALVLQESLEAEAEAEDFADRMPHAGM